MVESRSILFFFIFIKTKTSKSYIFSVYRYIKTQLQVIPPFKDKLVEVRQGPTQGTEEILGLHRLGQGQQ